MYSISIRANAQTDSKPRRQAQPRTGKGLDPAYSQEGTSGI